MTFFPIAPESDDRSRKGIARVRLQNCQLEPAPKGAAYGSKYLIKPTPGRTEVADLGGFIRGVFSAPGVQSGALFVAAGQTLYSLSSTYVSTTVGALAGADNVGFDEFRNRLVLRAGGQLKVWDGSSFDRVTDSDAPSSPNTIAQVGLRLISANVAGDAMDWSKAGLPLDWDASGTAADFYLADPIVSQARQGGDLISFNSASLQRWRPTGGSEAEAFAPILSASVSVGAISRDCVTRIGDELFFVSDESVPHRIGAGSPLPISNKGIEDAILALTDVQRSQIVGWGYTEGARMFYVIRAPGLDRGLCYDAALGLWHDRTSYGMSQYDLAYSTQAYGDTLVASPSDSKIWKLSRDVYTDAGQPIVRVMTVNVPLDADQSITSLAVQIQCGDQPLSGQGSAPSIMLRISRDGGKTWDPYVHSADLAAAGTYINRPTYWQLGYFSRQYGALFELSISDPIDFTVSGVWINEGRI